MADNFNADGGTALDCAARMLTRNLREHGKTQLMMYGRPSANYQFPSSMWLLPGGLNGWFAACGFQGLNQERIECSHQMVLVSCDEGQSNRTLYTIYPARDDFPLKWQIHWSYTFETHSRTYDMGNLFPACFAQVCTKLEPLLTRHQNLVVAQQETLRRTDRRQSAAFSGL